MSRVERKVSVSKASASRELPNDETSFFGRESEVSEVERRLDAGARVVTILGLGGLGKTRLAVVAAARTERVVTFVPLFEARSLEAAFRAIAHANRITLKAELSTGAAGEMLAEELAKKGPLLLVLDNVEQLGAAAKKLVAGLLAGAPELAILATSREPIGAKGEEKIVLEPLADDEAMALLRDRARLATGKASKITDADALAIVRRVDRLPLAIELAASRLEVLAPAELLTRLAASFSVLSDGARGASSEDPHRTMRATLDWSWDLLGEAERSALVQASVFAAPFGIDAAEEVIVLDEEHPVLDALESLVRRSLLSRVTSDIDGRVRLAMLETVRAWARDKSTSDGLGHRHALYHLREAEIAAAKTYGEGAVAALDTLDALLPELLVAFEAKRNGSSDVAARIVLSLSDLFLFRGPFERRAEIFAAGVEAAERSQDDSLVARTLIAEARSTLEAGHVQIAETNLRRAIELASRSGDDVTRAEATRSLGWAETALGNAEEAETTLAEAEALHRKHGSVRGIADVHVARGILAALQGRSADGLGELRAALSIHVEHGDVVRQEKVLGFAGLVGHDAQEVARGLPRDVLARAPRTSLETLPAPVATLVRGEKEVGLTWQRAVDMFREGAQAYDRGDPAAAVIALDGALAALERSGVKRGLATIHAHAAAAFANLGDAAEAQARLEKARAEAGDPAGDLVVAVFAAAVELMTKGADKNAAKALLGRSIRSEIATPELAVATRVLDRALNAPRGVTATSGPSGSATLVVGPESRWMTIPRGERLDLQRYGAVRRVLDRLVATRLDQPGTALSVDALIESGWPGEKMRRSAGLLRVYSAIRRLRLLGLEPILVTRDDGYLLDSRALVRRDEA